MTTPLETLPNNAQPLHQELTCISCQPEVMPNPRQHNEVELNLICSGSQTYLLGGDKVTMRAGELGLFWGAIPHQITDCSADSRYISVTIPLQSFLKWRLPERFVHLMMQGGLLKATRDERFNSDLALFEGWITDLQQPDSTEAIVSLEVRARLARLASNLSTDNTPQGQGQGPLEISASGIPKVEQMARYIAKSYTQKVSVQDIAKLVGLHPNYAMGLFQKSFGTTLIHYLTQHRLSHAQRLLTTTGESITKIGIQSGFQSISRFNDVFHKAFQCSPREYRKRHC